MSIAQMIAARRSILGSFLSGSLCDNPCIVAELRTRMRGTKGFTVMACYVLLLSIVLLIAFSSVWESGSNSGTSGLLANRTTGRTMFQILTWFQMSLLALIVPAVSAGALTREVERKTIELLALTPLSPGRIVSGRHLAGFLYCMTMLVCTIPLAALCMSFGGISPLEITAVYVSLTAWCFLFAAVSVFFSSLLNGTAAAVLFSYAVVVGYTLGSVGLGGYMMFERLYYGSAGEPFVLGLINPGFVAHFPLKTAQVCGMAVPMGIAAAVVGIVIGVVLLLVASTHVRLTRAHRPASIRAWLIGLLVMLVWLVVGNAFDAFPGMKPIKELLGAGSITVLILTGLLVPLFSTGRLRAKDTKSEPVCGSPTRVPKQIEPVFGAGTRGVFTTHGFTARAAFDNDIRGAALFMVILTVCTWLAFGLTMQWASSSASVALGNGFWTGYLKSGVTVVAITVGFCGVGLLASAVCTARKQAVAVVLVIAALALVGYLPFAAVYEPGKGTRGFADEAALFWPLTPLLVTTGDWDKNDPPLFCGNQNVWIVTSLIYLAVYAGCVMLASPARKRYGGIVREGLKT